LDELGKVVSTAARKLAKKTGRPALDHALNDGEDFELLAAISLQKLPHLPGHVKLLPIGRLVKGSKIHIVSAAGQKNELVPHAFRHF
jgi:thiamine monophosphate kinase